MPVDGKIFVVLSKTSRVRDYGFSFKEYEWSALYTLTSAYDISIIVDYTYHLNHRISNLYITFLLIKIFPGFLLGL